VTTGAFIRALGPLFFDCPKRAHETLVIKAVPQILKLRLLKQLADETADDALARADSKSAIEFLEYRVL
jgi:hypothetical protein